MKRREILQKINIERARQDAKWGYPQKNTLPEWGIILGEEVGEAMKELNELHFRQPALPSLALGCLITELIQTAAVAVSIVEHLTEYGIAVDDRYPVCFENRIKTDADQVPEDDCPYIDENGICLRLSDNGVKQPCIEGPCEWTAHRKSLKKYVCIAKCPELDYGNDPHCVTMNREDFCDKYVGSCPVGNVPVWEEVHHE